MRLKNGEAGTGERFMAALLAAAMVVYWVPAGVHAAETPARLAEIQGSIFAADGLTAVSGVSVKAANLETRQVYTSGATSQDGAYKLTGLPDGTYDLAVQTGDGLYVADVLVEAKSSQPTLVSLALSPQLAAAAPEDEGEEQPGEEEQTEMSEEEAEETTPAETPEPEQKKKKKKGPGFWRSPTGAAIVIVVGAGLVGAAANSVADDSSTNSITPNN